MDVEGAARQGRGSELLGHLVPALPKENADLETLYKQFKDQGLVILAISDEDAGKVATVYCGAKGHLSDPARSRAKGERTLPDRGNSQDIVTIAAASLSRSRSTCEPEDNFWRC